MKPSKSQSLSRFQTDMHRLLTIILQRDVEDPMLRGMSLTRFQVTDENGLAIAYMHSILPVDQHECVRRLNKLAPHILHLLRQAMPKRCLPSLTFRWDENLDKTHQVMDTMSTLRR